MLVSHRSYADSTCDVSFMRHNCGARLASERRRAGALPPVPVTEVHTVYGSSGGLRCNGLQQQSVCTLHISLHTARGVQFEARAKLFQAQHTSGVRLRGCEYYEYKVYILYATTVSSAHVACLKTLVKVNRHVLHVPSGRDFVMQ